MQAYQYASARARIRLTVLRHEIRITLRLLLTTIYMLVGGSLTRESSLMGPVRVAMAAGFIRALLDRGLASASVQDRDGATPLYYAAAKGSAATVEALLAS